MSSGGSPSIFSYAGLHALLASLKARHALFPLRDWNGQSGIILRHDVDLALAPARQLAELEAQLELAATFFCMTSAETYNVSSPTNRRALREIDALGGEIGLHFDPTLYPGAVGEELLLATRHEADLLEQVIGRKVESVSLHNPSVTGEFPLFDGWRNAYDPRIFTAQSYLSDSRMVFRSDPTNFFESDTARTCQLLLHPMHYSEQGSPYPAPMLEHLHRSAVQLNEVFAVNSEFERLVGDHFLRDLADAAAMWARDESGPAKV